MNLLFIHQNYPGQYREILPRLAASGLHRIVFLTQRRKFPEPKNHTVAVYRPDYEPKPDAYSYTAWYERCIGNAVGVMKAARELAARGFKPDIVVGHAGWGELILVKQVWPRVPVIAYFEYYFIPKGGLINFDPEVREGPDIAAKLIARSGPAYLSLIGCDGGHTASQWQKQTFPPLFHDMIEVVHEGIRTDLLQPDHNGAQPLTIGQLTFNRGDEIVSYVARNLEPSRGFHILMRALPALQRMRPKARVVIVGADGTSYGGSLANGETFRKRLTAEMGDKVDWSRVHFVGQIPYAALVRLMQLAGCHVYLTAPFVVSWSLLEAMALEKAVVATDVAPVRQYVEHGRTGLLVDFFDADALAAQVADVLAHPDHYRTIGAAARQVVVEHFDFASICYPRFLALLNRHLPAGAGTEL